MSRPAGEQQGIQSVEVAIRALEAIERLGRPAALSAVASEAGLSPSTTHRYLVSLARVGLVDQSAVTARYDFGPVLRRLGIEAMRRSDDVGVATAYAGALRDAIGHTVNISVWSDCGPTIMRWEHGRYPLPIVARVGSTLPIADSSVGQVFLAYLPRSITTPVLRNQQRHRECSTPAAPALEKMRADVRARGVANTAGAVAPGLIVVAAPSFGPGGVLSVVLGCAIPSRVAHHSVVQDAEHRLSATADALSTQLGGPTWHEFRPSD